MGAPNHLIFTDSNYKKKKETAIQDAADVHLTTDWLEAHLITSAETFKPTHSGEVPKTSRFHTPRLSPHKLQTSSGCKMLLDGVMHSLNQHAGYIGAF